MAYIEQRHWTDCGIAALAMLCDVSYEDAYRAIPWGKRGCLYGTTTKQVRAGARKLGYEGRGTEKNRLIPLGKMTWADIPDNSLVKIPHPDPKVYDSHWVVLRKGKIYDPARGVFTARVYGHRPTSYMHFIKMENGNE